MNINLYTYNGPCIYTIWTSDNPDKVYIGKTVNYNIRAKRHINDFKAKRHGNMYMQRLFNKGCEFNICPLEFCTKEVLSSKEEFWIKFYKTNILGYNLSKGGESIPDKLLKWSEERKKERSDYCKKNPLSKGVKRSKTWHYKMQISIQNRKNNGTLVIHLNKPCTVTNIKDGTSIKYKNIKEATIFNSINYTYATKKLKINNGKTIIKQFKLEING